MRTLILSLLIFIVFCIVSSHNLVVFHQNIGLENNYKSPSIIYDELDWDPITAEFQIAEPIHACDTLTSHNYSGRIVYFEHITEDHIIRCDITQAINNIHESGAAGVMVRFGNVGMAGYMSRADHRHYHDLFQGIEFMPEGNFVSIVNAALANSTKITVTITDDPSEWEALFDSGVTSFVVAMILELFACSTLILACYKLSGFLVYRGFSLTIQVAVLCVEIVSNLIRIVLFVDPILTQGVFTNRAYDVLSIASIPFTLTGNLLLSFFWQEIMRRNSIQAVPSMRTLRWPCVLSVVIVFITLILYIIFTTTFAPIPRLDVFIIVIFSAVTGTVGVFYLVAGFRVLHVVQQSQSRNQSEKNIKLRNNLKRVTTLLSVSGISLLFEVLFHCFSILSKGSAVGYLIVRSLFFASIQTSSFAVVSTFLRPESEERSSSDRNTPKKNTTKSEEDSRNSKQVEANGADLELDIL